MKYCPGIYLRLYCNITPVQLMPFTFCKNIAVISALLILSVCGYAQKKPWPRTFLWRIYGNGLSKPSFLYGTIHLTDKKLFYFSDSLYHYLEQAEGFNLEIDADTMINASVRKWAQNNNGRLVKSLMKNKDYEKYADKLSKNLGKPADKITTRDIWLAKKEKSAEAYKKGDMQNFMDLYLYGIAKKQGKKVGGIEDLADQMDIIDNLFDEVDVAYVALDTLQDAGTGMIEKMKAIYVQQDLDGMAALTENSFTQQDKDIVLTRRNLKMARRMDSLARQRSSFFAVGVAHLPGDTGVIELLRKRGFSVEPVFSSTKIAPENYTYKTVDRPWMPFTHDLHLYHAEAPGVLQPMDVMKEMMDMEFYYDVPTGKAYYTAVINSVADINKKDSVFAAMISRMASGNRTLISQKNIIKQQYEGRDVLIKATKDQVLHLNVFLAGSYAYLSMVLCKTSEANDNDAKRFLDSFTMTPVSSFTRPYLHYRDTALAFSINLPQEPVINEDSDQASETGTVKTISATDFSSGNSYAVTVRNTKAGRYIQSDSNYFGQIKTGLITAMKSDTVVESLMYSGFPALRMAGSSNTENVYYQTLAVLRGNRSYFLLAQSKKATAANALTDSFFHSFVLDDYSGSDWKNYTAPDHSFTGWLPAPFTDKDTEEPFDGTTVPLPNGPVPVLDENKDAGEEFLFYDKSTGTSYNIQREVFSKYFYSANDSTLFSNAGLTFRAEGDSIAYFNLLYADKDPAADIQIENANSSIIKKLRLILHGDTLFKVFTYTPRWLAKHDNTQRFFNRFSVTSAASPTTVFTNKSGRLIADLSSSDSATFARASDYLYTEGLHKNDLQAYHPLLVKPLKDFSESPYNTNNRVVESIAAIADSSTVNFVMQRYDTLKDAQQQLQYPLLKLLVFMKQPYAGEAVVKLLQSPDVPAGYAGSFAIALVDNLPLAKELFPKIISFTKDTAAALQYAYLIKSLLDSHYVSKQEVLPYLDNFITAASLQQKKIRHNADDFDYHLTNVLDLLGALNTPVTNAKLRDYSKVNNLDISYTTVTWLIRNKQSPAADAVNKLAASNAYRAELYDTLKKVNQTAMFPAAQLTQKLFAASYLYRYAAQDDNTPGSIRYVMEKIVDFRGSKYKFYLFDVTGAEDNDTTHSLGIAGPFSPGAATVTSTNAATGIYWKEGYSFKEISHQLKEYLKQLEIKE